MDHFCLSNFLLSSLRSLQFSIISLSCVSICFFAAWRSISSSLFLLGGGGVWSDWANHWTRFMQLLENISKAICCHKLRWGRTKCCVFGQFLSLSKVFQCSAKDTEDYCDQCFLHELTSGCIDPDNKEEEEELESEFLQTISVKSKSLRIHPGMGVSSERVSIWINWQNRFFFSLSQHHHLQLLCITFSFKSNNLIIKRIINTHFFSFFFFFFVPFLQPLPSSFNQKTNKSEKRPQEWTYGYNIRFFFKSSKEIFEVTSILKTLWLQVQLKLTLM